jgi:5'-3' exonuclease
MIVIFDLNHVAYRCLFAGLNDIKDVGWAYFKHMLYNHIFSVCKKFNATEVILCIDSKENWRKKIYPDYKATRKEQREDNTDIDWNQFFKAYQEFTEEVKEHFPFYVLQIKYMEADDLVAILARDWQKYEKIVVTSDSDYNQLLKYNNIKIWDPIKLAWRKSDDPEKELQIKILSGDKGDNIPSIKPRVGVGTAEKLVNSPELLQKLFEEKTPAYTKKDGTVVTLGEEYKERYKLNTALIDLSKIPQVFSKALHKNLAEYVLPDGKTIFNYFSKNKFREFMRRIEEIEMIVRLVVDSPRIPKNQTQDDISELFTQ